MPVPPLNRQYLTADLHTSLKASGILVTITIHTKPEAMNSSLSAKKYPGIVKVETRVTTSTTKTIQQQSEPQEGSVGVSISLWQTVA